MPTLDIPEQQLLIDYFDDPNGFVWHHSPLLVHVKDTLGIIATPDSSVQLLDVSRHRLVILSHSSPFPADRAGQTYACDPADFGDDVMARLRSEAQAMA